MTNYKSSNLTAAECDALLVEELNLFFARFEVESPKYPRHQPTAASSSQWRRRTLRLVNPRKAADPDYVPGLVLKDYTDQLAGVITRIYNRLLSQSTVPTSSAKKKRP